MFVLDKTLILDEDVTTLLDKTFIFDEDVTTLFGLKCAYPICTWI